jgi:uncharacterized membrane protein YfcA
MVGVGGGFLLVPALALFIFNDMHHSYITSISLAAVLGNALSASIGYRQRRIQDFRTAGILITMAVPAAAVGKVLNITVDPKAFYPVFGGALIAGAVYLLARTLLEKGSQEPAAKGRSRHIVERSGRTYDYRVNEPIAASFAPPAGFVAGFFGIGGGIVNVPVMLTVLRMPANVAVATSQLELVCAAATALAVQFLATSGSLTMLGISIPDPAGCTMDSWEWPAVIVAASTMVGAQLGVRLAPKVGARFVLGVIGIGLIAAGLKLILSPGCGA